MGCCSSSEDVKQNREVQSELTHDKKVDQNVKKLLFLGSGGSGKSTLFKQLRTIHGKGFEDKDRSGYKDHIYSQVIEQMKMLIESAQDLKEDEPEEFGHLQLTQKGQEAAEYVDSVRGDMDVDDALADHIEVLWKEEAIQTTFGERARLKIDDSSAYFFDEVRRIAVRGFIPSDKDILLVRHRTTGVIEQKFDIRGTTFHIFDVGGQRSERKKWIHCFEHVTAVIFVAALSSYNEVMYEDESCNSMIDSLDLFNEICNLRWFTNTAMILFLNKQDLFAEKIQTVPLTVCFEDYDGGDEYDECVAFIRAQFEGQNENPNKPIYTHVTMATDKSNVERVFGDVQHIVINSSLVKGGLI